MCRFIALFFLLSATALHAQTVANGAQVLAWSQAIAVDTSYSSGYLLMSGDIGSMTVTPGKVDQQAYYFRVCVDRLGPYAITQAAPNLLGNTALPPSNTCARYRWDWSSATQTWTSTLLNYAPYGQGSQGPDGRPGRDGVDGKDGLPGAPGKDGLNGSNGKDGTNGKDGLPGAPGKDGVNGTNGKDGVNGTNGKDGLPGAAGKDGTNGTNGLNGKDGTNGVNGADGKPGTPYAPIFATTASTGGTLIVALGCTQPVTIDMPGSIVGRYVQMFPASGWLTPGLTPQAQVLTAGKVTYRLCALAAITPPAIVYTLQQ